MNERCLEQGMKLGRWLQVLGLNASLIANRPDETYQRLSKAAEEALRDVEGFTCLAANEKETIVNELTYLRDSAKQTQFLGTSDAGNRLLHLLSNPQFYIEYYKL